MDNTAPDFVGSGFKAVFQKPVSTTTPPVANIPSAAPANETAPMVDTSAPVVGMTTESVVTSFAPGQKAPNEKKRINAKGAIFVVGLVLLLGGLVAGFGKIRSFISQAEGTCTPESVTEANLTSDSVEVVFSTGKACQMSITYGISSQALLLEVPETMASLNHRFRLTPLLSTTTYYYQVISGEKKVSPVRSFLSKAPVNTAPTEEPTIVPVITSEPSPIVESAPAGQEASPSATYTYEDFKSQFGGTNPNFDIDKNGVVNQADWLLYQRK